MHKAGFVNLFGKPNAGKSTLINALTGEKLAITSPKVQTTRHRIIGILDHPDYQVVFSDTPGIIQPKYKLQERMMGAVKMALEDADLALMVVDSLQDQASTLELFSSLGIRIPGIVALNKMDRLRPEALEQLRDQYGALPFVRKVIAVSALKNQNLQELIAAILEFLPESEKFYPGGEITDRPVRFFVGELIREEIFMLYQEEIPYHTTVQVTAFEEKTTLVKIRAEIIVQRETQKIIILGEKGKAIKALGTRSRIKIESYLGRKVFLDLFVKVRSGWSNNDLYLREYGY